MKQVEGRPLMFTIDWGHDRILGWWVIVMWRSKVMLASFDRSLAPLKHEVWYLFGIEPEEWGE